VREAILARKLWIYRGKLSVPWLAVITPLILLAHHERFRRLSNSSTYEAVRAIVWTRIFIALQQSTPLATEKRDILTLLRAMPRQMATGHQDFGTESWAFT
jgi:hypothetical protein